MMAGNVRAMLLMLFGLLLFVTIGADALKEEYNDYKERRTNLSSHLEVMYDYEELGDLSYISGNDLIGMVLYANEGEYTLVLDGVMIDENTDLNYLNVMGVFNKDYRMQVSRDSITKEVTVYANVIP